LRIKEQETRLSLHEHDDDDHDDDDKYDTTVKPFRRRCDCSENVLSGTPCQFIDFSVFLIFPFLLK